MSQNVAVFFTQPSGLERVSLRRFVFSSQAKCSGPWGYHNAETLIGKFPERRGAPCDSGRGYYGGLWRAEEFKGDPRWPTHCSCGYEFTPKDEWQVFTDDVMVRADGLGGEYSRRDSVVGQMWDCFWIGERYKSVDGGAGWVNVGPDGLALSVVLPSRSSDGEWRTTDFMPESRCSNCTRRDDGEHHCWVRHGDARKNECHLDKNGNTCSAGAGSIVTHGWHGFIHHGFVTDVPDILVR